MVTRPRPAIRMSIGETFPGRSDGGRDSGRLERGSRPNELLELQRKGQALTIWGGLRKQAVNNGLIMISQNKREHANDRNVIVIQWEKTITMQAWVLGRIKRFGPHRRRKENLVRKKKIIIFKKGLVWVNAPVLRSKEWLEIRFDVARRGTTFGCFRTVGCSSKQRVGSRLGAGYRGEVLGIGYKKLRPPACGSQTLCRKRVIKESGNMADGVTQLMENLSFSEEELLEIGNTTGGGSGTGS
ncbi:hypothetical protein V6N11_076763 [Hibiscus sabdariffa]|uniref:DUF4283 domain-containing protein n=1 Tax=Hibiscus sabdariffa TaxID=183260 RepID=A0ABR2P9F0_9ROSI